MDTMDTPGKRLRYFSNTFFTSVTSFAHQLGYQKPGSLYDYFNDRKKPGGLLLDRFRMLGGDPNWLRYGTGSMFADSDTGNTLRTRYGSSRPYIPADNAVHEAEPQNSYRPEEAAGIATEYNLEHSEALYVLISRSLYRLKTSPPIAPNALQLYRELITSIEQEIDLRENK